ncbi:MAG: NUDIX domain-containing protein [Gammaproteobacteria bacterium]|nr:NUDIX domain-containing protein [Gammaproteobacteria bacterium]
MAVNGTPPVERIVLPIRNAVRALVLRQGRILLLRKRYAGNVLRYALPGGGQDPGESLHDALQRECREEIGTEVAVLDLRHVADVFREREAGGYRQQVEFVFLCRLPRGYEPVCGSKPDRRQEAVEWVGLQRLDEIDLRPAGYAALIRQVALDAGHVYAGLLTSP